MWAVHFFLVGAERWLITMQLSHAERCGCFDRVTTERESFYHTLASLFSLIEVLPVHWIHFLMLESNVGYLLPVFFPSSCWVFSSGASMLVSRSILNLRQNYASKGIDGSTLHISDMASIRFEPHESLSFEQDDLDVWLQRWHGRRSPILRQSHEYPYIRISPRLRYPGLKCFMKLLRVDRRSRR